MAELSPQVRDDAGFLPLGTAAGAVVLRAIAARRVAMAARGMAEGPEFEAFLRAAERDALTRAGGA